MTLSAVYSVCLEYQFGPIIISSGETCCAKRGHFSCCRLNNRALSEFVKSSRSDRSKGEEAVKRPEPCTLVRLVKESERGGGGEEMSTFVEPIHEDKCRLGTPRPRIALALSVMNIHWSIKLDPLPPAILPFSLRVYRFNYLPAARARN